MDYNVTRRILNKGKSMSKFRWLGVLILLAIIGISVRYFLKSKNTQNDVDSTNVAVSVQQNDNNLILNNIVESQNSHEIGEETIPVPVSPIPGLESPIIDNKNLVDGQQLQLPSIPGQQPGLPGQQLQLPSIPGQQLQLPSIPGQQPGLPGQQLQLPSIPGQQPGLSEKVDTVKKNEQSKNPQEIEYIIQEGDTLGKICKRHYNNESLATALQKYNNISDARKMHAKDKIKLPPIEKLGKSSNKTVAETKKTTEKQTSNSKVVQQNKAGKEYIIQRGDTLAKISQKSYNTTTLATALQKYNNITDATKLKIGQTIVIPSKEVLQPNKINGNKQVQSKDTSKQDSKYYIVQRGDNLPGIARKLDTTPSAIMDCNPEIAKDPEKIIPGMKILKPAN